MTLYHVYRGVAPLTWREILNPERSDGRWPGENPDEVGEEVSHFEAQSSNLPFPYFPGQYLIVPQHRNTLVDVDQDGHPKRVTRSFA